MILHIRKTELCVLELSNDDILISVDIYIGFTGDFVYNFDYSKHILALYIDLWMILERDFEEWTVI
jgi:hypothetical protein